MRHYSHPHRLPPKLSRLPRAWVLAAFAVAWIALQYLWEWAASAP